MSQDDTTDYHPQRWECSNCGYAFFDEDAWESWYCRHCGEEMEMIAPRGYVDKHDLRKLVEQWRRVSTLKRFAQDHAENGKGDALKQCADQVEELINDD